MAQLILHGVTYRYPDAAEPALDGVTLEVDEGELVLVVGDSGSGKSTLLRAAVGLVPHFHGGELRGRVLTGGLDTRSHRPGELAAHAGLVFGDPEAQIVLTSVAREAAFGLENLACPPEEIPFRAEEALMLTGASRLAERATETLSGGEKQRVAIASVLAMGQRLLLLDEPTSQLDPVAAEELLGLVVRLNRDRGLTVVLAEHRTGRIFPEADRVLVLEAGAVVWDGDPASAARYLRSAAPQLLPPVARAFAAAGKRALPLSVREVRALGVEAGGAGGEEAPPAEPPAAVAVRGAWKRLGDVDALRGATLRVGGGELRALVGENGAGKTTLALAASGLVALDRGRVETAPGARVGYVGQDPAHYLVHDTVRQELDYGPRNLGLEPSERRHRVARALAQLGLDALADRHPRDLSSGERQRVAIGSVLTLEPAVLVLDEPTRGLDARRKEALGALLGGLAGGGAAVVIVTHDIDFAAEACDTVTVLARGRTLVERAPRSLFARGTFFASQVGLALGHASIAEAAAALAETQSPGSPAHV